MQPSEQHAITLANDPTTSPEMLEYLARADQDQSIRRLVASNPNTPLNVLMQLVKNFHRRIGYYAFGKPPQNDAEYRYKLQKEYVEILDRLAEDESVRRIVANLPKIPKIWRARPASR